MGQRCAILLKKNYGENKSTLNLIHHQWGIGKVLPSLVLQEVLKYCYPLDRSLNYIDNEKGKMPIDYFFTFKPLSNKRSNYIFNKKIKTNLVNVWDKDTRVNYFNMTDNNNGGVVIEVTQLYDKKGSFVPYGDSLEVKIGYVLGNEEMYNDNAKIEEEFERLVSCKEFVTKTFSTGNENGSNKQFIDSYNNLCELFDIKHIVD